MDQSLIDNTQNFGTRLKTAREQAGFDLETLARRLHIRPDIILSIENADFQNMPASGYAKNMIRSYARTVGLNQNEITEAYLTSLDAHNRVETREDVLSQAQPRKTSSRRGSFLDLDTSASTSERELLSDRPERVSHNQNHLPNSRKSLRETRSIRQQKGYYSNAGTRNHIKTKSMQSTYTLGKAPRPSIPNLDYRKFIIPALACVVIIILLILIFNLAFGSKDNSASDEIPAMPISGLTDTSNKDDESTSDTTTKSVKDHVTFKIEVSSGAESWCTVSLDGTQTFANVISGPDSKTFEVKGTLEFTTANSGPVKVYIDDAEQTLTANTTTGMYVFTYTFDSNSVNKTQ